MTRGLAGAAAIAVMLTAVLAGCGAQHSTATTPPRVAKKPATASRRPMSRLQIERILSRGGELPDTCPKAIAANCVPGRMEAAGVCVGRKGRIARTPTMRDFRRMQAEAARVQREREGKTPKPQKQRKPPTTITGHMLPSGRFVGTCNYGSGPRPAPPPSPAVIARNE